MMFFLFQSYPIYFNFILLPILTSIIIQQSNNNIFQTMKRSRVAIDYGPRIIGIAYSNYFNQVQPYNTIRNHGNLTGISNQILDIVKQFSASEVIIGIPLDSNGRLHYNIKNLNGQLCLNFSKVFSSVAANQYHSNFQTILFDERYTTKEARIRIKSDKIKASIDSMSAACLLERYIEDQGDGSILAEPCTYPPPLDIACFDYNIVRNHIYQLYYNNNQNNLQNKGGQNIQTAIELMKNRGVTAPKHFNKQIKSNIISTTIDNNNSIIKEDNINTNILTNITEYQLFDNLDLNDNNNIYSIINTTINIDLNDLEEQEKEYELIRSQRRKKGTLKKKKIE